MKRFDWLNAMIKTYNLRVGAEIGSGTGKTMLEILKSNLKLHLIQVAYYPNSHLSASTIDPIEHCTTANAKRLWARRIKLYRKRITLFEMPSREAAKEVGEEVLDFVFIDADHSYEECLADIKLWTPKVRKGGLVSGHDYMHPNFPGVARAVHEVFGKSVNKTQDDHVWFTWKES